MTFWRQGSNDSLNDKLVRPRNSNSYWDRKQPIAESGHKANLALKDSQDVFSDVSDQIEESAESTYSAYDDSKDEITRAVDKIFPDESSSAPKREIPDLPDFEMNASDDSSYDSFEELDEAYGMPELPSIPEIPEATAYEAAPEDVDLELPELEVPTLEEPVSHYQNASNRADDSVSASSLETLSWDQEDEDDIEEETSVSSDIEEDEDEDEEAFYSELEELEALEAQEALEAADNLDMPELEIKDLETPNLETQELNEPENEDRSREYSSAETMKMPPVIPAGGRSTGNTAHKFEEEFENSDANFSSESETVDVPKAIPEDTERNTPARQDSTFRDRNGLGQIIAFPPSHGKQSSSSEKIAASFVDQPTDEEIFAESLADKDVPVSPDNSRDSLFSARIAKPKNDGPFVTPRRTAASYHDSPEQVYEAGLEDDDGFYVPSQDNSEGSGRRIALYLAGAASISAICGAVYLMLPKGQIEDYQTVDAGKSTASPTLPSITTTTREAEVTPPEAGPIIAAGADSALNDNRVFEDLTTTSTVEVETAISTPTTELFASATTEAVDTNTGTTAINDARSLTPNTATLSTPELKSADVSKPIVTEEAPRLTLSQPKEIVTAEPVQPVDQAPVETAPAITPKQEITPEVAIAPIASPDISAPKSAPKLANRKLFSGTKSAETSTQSRLPKILRAPKETSIAPLTVNIGERIYDGVMRAGSMPQTIIDALFANGAYLSSVEHKQFAYNVRHAAKTTRDGETNTIFTQNGTRVDLHFMNTQNEVRPTFVTRSDKVESLPRYMLLQDDWARVVTPTKLYAAPRQYDQVILKSLPLSTTLERMGSVTDSSGEQWSMVGQNGIAIGYVPSANLTSLTNSVSQTVTPFNMPLSSSIIEKIDVSVPCRDYSLTIAGSGSMHSACMTPEGDWMTKEGINSGLSYAIAPSSPSISNIGREITPNLTYSAAPQRSTLSADAEAILFQPETLRRDARHGLGSASQRIGSLFSQTGAISIAGPNGQLGQLSLPAKTNDSLSTTSSANTEYVQANRQVRLMNAPAGSVVQETDTVKRGDVLEAISASKSSSGESWTLLGEDGVGYGYVLSDYVSSISSYDAQASNIYAGYNSATSLNGEDVTRVAEINDSYESPAPDCQIATFAAGSEQGVLKACLQTNGTWTAEVTPSTRYDIRATAHLDQLAGGNSLW